MIIKCSDDIELDVKEEELQKFMYFQNLISMGDTMMQIEVPFDSDTMKRMFDFSKTNCMNFMTISQTNDELNKNCQMLSIDYSKKNNNTTNHYQYLNSLSQSHDGLFYLENPTVTYNRRINKRFTYSAPYNFYSYQNLEFGKGTEFIIDLKKENIDIVEEISVVFEILTGDHTLVNDAGSKIFDRIQIEYMDTMYGPIQVFDADTTLLSILNKLKFKPVNDYVFQLDPEQRKKKCRRLVPLMLSIPLRSLCSDHIIAMKENSLKFIVQINDWEKIIEPVDTEYMIPSGQRSPKIYRSYVTLECRETFDLINNNGPNENNRDMDYVVIRPLKKVINVTNQYSPESQVSRINIDKGLNLQEFYIVMKSKNDENLDFLIDCKIVSQREEKEETLFHATNHILRLYGPKKFLDVEEPDHNIYYWSFNQAVQNNAYNQYLATSQFQDVVMQIQYYGFDGQIIVYLMDVSLHKYFVQRS